MYSLSRYTDNDLIFKLVPAHIFLGLSHISWMFGCITTLTYVFTIPQKVHFIAHGISVFGTYLK